MVLLARRGSTWTAAYIPSQGAGRSSPCCMMGVSILWFKFLLVDSQVEKNNQLVTCINPVNIRACPYSCCECGLRFLHYLCLYFPFLCSSAFFLPFSSSVFPRSAEGFAQPKRFPLLQRFPSPIICLFRIHLSRLVESLWSGAPALGSQQGGGCPSPSRWARIFKRLWSPGIDSKEWISPAYVAWRAGTIALFLLGS